MKKLVAALVLLPLLAVAAPPEKRPIVANVEGAWEGALKVMAIQLRVVFKIKKTGDKLTATLDSPDQGAKDVPFDEAIFQDGKLTLKLARAMATYEGKLDGQKLTGTWTQNGNALPLELSRTDHPTNVAAKPQEPKPPLPYEAIDVTVASKGTVKLACTLTEPRGKGPFTAVALITGSGAQDRDEQLLGHKPFLVLADALTRKGIAVLRCDDRGFAKSTGDLMTATTYNFVDDALAQVRFLLVRPEIDKAHVGLVGHSEGGVIAPMAAAESKDVAFIVMLAGTGLPGEDILYLQGAKMMKAEGKSDADIKLETETQKKVFAILHTEKDDAVIARKMREIWAALPEDQRKKQENSEAQLGMQIKTVTSPWFKAFLTLDPRTYLKQVKVPVLALNGERDMQVPPKENLPQIQAALKGNPDVTVKELPELNHLFQHCKTGALSEYSKIDETFSPQALELIGDWIVTRAHPAKGR
jgi:pimeloyl-ACP methyl ester carboxylesterase